MKTSTSQKPATSKLVARFDKMLMELLMTDLKAMKAAKQLKTAA